ncbi:hypothetical protein ACH5RR_005464 [Cinchona calisaya]|uniref:Uncharacterized protein n=1 Tax=Cinchona calisaya TaxID=153742 RepID=A0ABD3AL92_9GENT
MNIQRQSRGASLGIPVFNQSGPSSIVEGIKGRNMIIKKNGMHSKFGTRESKNNENQGSKTPNQIKRKALDGRRFKELFKMRAKNENATSEHVLGEKNKLFQGDGNCAEANTLKKVGETIVEKPGSSDERTCPCRMVSHQTQETCSGDVMQNHNISGVTLVANEDTRAELEMEPTSKQDHTHFSDSQKDMELKSKHKRCINCGQGGKLLCCVGQGCGRSFHLPCVNPPFTYFPPGDWHCIWCVKKKMELGVYTVSEGIECVLNSEQVSADGAMQKQQYLVKYKGLAHVHNCWIPEKRLLAEAPILFERYKKKTRKVSWKRQWSEPQRLLAKRLLVFPKQCSSNFQEHDHCHHEWLVKWTGLGYNQVTWELENAPFLRNPEGMTLVKDFGNRHERMKGDERRKTELAELPFGDPDHLIYVNKLRKGWHKDHNVLVIDSQERVVRVVLFLFSLLKESSGPFLIITTSASLSMWEAEFQRWAANVNVVLYKGSGDIRVIIRTLEFYNEGGNIMFQVLLSPSIAVVEDLEDLKPIEWEVIVVDECQRPTMSVHLEQIKMLAANMRLLLVSSHIKDWSFNYLNILSLLDPKYAGADNDLFEADTSKLKKRLVDFIAYECKNEPVKFMEFWVPVMLTDVQTEQYCASLFSNSMVLCSYLKSGATGSIHDILKTTRKCCDHPYLVDRSLRNLVLQGKPASDHFDIEIQMSGKLQLLNKILPEIKRRGLRVLILFQAIESSEKISIGDILDDFIHQKFGTDSYVRIDGEIARAKKRAAFDMFNNKDNGNFVCLIETRACLPSTKLSSVDTVIIFNSDWDPVNDLKALQKITIDSRFEQLKIFRIYSSYSVEENVLMLAKEGLTLDSYIQNIKQSVCHKLLTWGASCLFRKLDGSHELNASSLNPINSFEQTLLEDVFQELSALLPCSSVEHGSTCCFCRKSNSNNVLSVEQSEGNYCGKNLSLIGELKTRSMHNLPGTRQLTEDGPPHIFWTNLFKGRKPRWKYMSSSLQGKRKLKLIPSLSEDAEYEGKASKKGRTEANSILNPIPYHMLIMERRRGNKKKNAENSPNSALKKFRNAHNLARNVIVKRAKKAAVISRDHGMKVHWYSEAATLNAVGRPVNGAPPEVKSGHLPVQSSSLQNEMPLSTNSVSTGHEEADFSESTEGNDHVVSVPCYEVQATTGTPSEGSTQPLSPAVQPSVRNFPLQPAMTPPVNRTEPDAANLEHANIDPDYLSNHSTEALSGTFEIPRSACLASLQREMERIQEAQEHAIKFHEDLKLHLKSECEKELEEIHKKYDLLLHNSELVMAQKKTYLDSCYQMVHKQKLLADSILLKQDGVPAAEPQEKQEVTLATFLSDIYQSCFIQPSERTISGPYPPGNPSPLVASNLSAVPQAAAMNPSNAEQDLARPQTSVRSSTTSVEAVNYSSAGQQTTAPSILRAEISSSNMPKIRPSETSAVLVMAHSSAGTRATSAYGQSSTSLEMTGSSKSPSRPEHTSVLSTSHLRPPSIPNIRLSGNLHAGREVRAPAPHLRHTIPSPVILHSTSRPC